MSCRSTLALILAIGLIAPAIADDAPDYESQIRPLLSQKCFECHGSQKQESGLRLDVKKRAMAGGDGTDQVIVPGKSAASELIRRITSTDDSEWMPPKGRRLNADEVELITRWIDSGATWPDDGIEIHATQPSKTITPEQRSYWAYQPLRVQEPPHVDGAGWPRTPIDAFIFDKLQREGLAPAVEASRAELIRRVAFDLTGLPPTLEELDRYLQDSSPNAYEQMVDRYLASPHYGERWGQHWLDVVRFAESEGFEYDRPVTSLWKYRDYVIRSFNDDKPYDQFVREQIAGDEYAQNVEDDANIAAGFHRLGPVRRNAGNQEVASSRNEVLSDRTDAVGAVFMGMTVGCARCHDHKFDPILQKDYYRLQAYLGATDENNIPLVSAEEQKAWKTRNDQLTRQIQQLRRQFDNASDEKKAELKTKILALEDELPDTLPGVSTIKNMEEPQAIHLLLRGDWTRKGEVVGPRPPSVLVDDQLAELDPSCSKPRTELARWLVDPEKNPLAVRVIVNRIWQYHFGLGFVKTPNDFGVNGDRQPQHRELLDYLSREFVLNGWKFKPMHKLILMSNVYRQAGSNPLEAKANKLDPENRWLWRFSRRRLDANELRDAMLSVSGKLYDRMGGEAIFLPTDPELTKMLYKPSQWMVTKNAREHDRRSVYLVAKRNLRLPFMEVFDSPTLGASCGRRETSTHSPQALEMLNGAISNELAEAFAKRLQELAGDDSARQVELAFRLATGRLPTEAEQRLGQEFLKTQSLKEFALAVFNLNAFFYVN